MRKNIKQKIKHLPNAISFLRIIISFFLLAAMQNKKLFLILIAIAGLTDILDGFFARKLNVQSQLGARLDSIGDTVFFVCATIGVVYITHINPTVIFGIAAIAAVRFTNLLLFRIRFKKFAGIHTVGNKISGLIIFALLLYAVTAKNISLFVLIPLLSVIFLFAIEETVIICILKDADYNVKSIISLRH